MAKPVPQPLADLKSQMDQAGVSELEFAAFFGVPTGTVRAWIEGRRAVPLWVRAALRALSLLSESALRKLLNRPAPKRLRKPRSPEESSPEEGSQEARSHEGSSPKERLHESFASSLLMMPPERAPGRAGELRHAIQRHPFARIEDL